MTSFLKVKEKRRGERNPLKKKWEKLHHESFFSGQFRQG